MTQEDQSWHLDKRVPVTLIMVLLAQIAFGGYWIAQQESRISHVEEALVQLSSTVSDNKNWQIEQRIRVWNELNSLASKQNDTNESLARLEGQLEQINNNMERLLDRMERNG